MKSIIKDKLSSSVQKKEDDASLKQLHASFPTDKPTFDLSNLQADTDTSPLIDENRLATKAQAIVDKFGEF